MFTAIGQHIARKSEKTLKGRRSELILTLQRPSAYHTPIHLQLTVNNPASLSSQGSAKMPSEALICQRDRVFYPANHQRECTGPKRLSEAMNGSLSPLGNWIGRPLAERAGIKHPDKML